MTGIQHKACQLIRNRFRQTVDLIAKFDIAAAVWMQNRAHTVAVGTLAQALEMADQLIPLFFL